MPATATNLHTHAQQAEKHLEQLATGLAQAGSDEQAVKAVGQMADAMRKITSQLAKAAEQTPTREDVAAEQTQPATMSSATDDLQRELAARRA